MRYRHLSLLLVCGLFLAGAVLAEPDHDDKGLGGNGSGASPGGGGGPSQSKRDVAPLAPDIEKLARELEEGMRKMEKKTAEAEKALFDEINKVFGSLATKPRGKGEKDLPDFEDLTPDLVKTMPLDKLEAVAAREAYLHKLTDDMFRKRKSSPALNMEHTALQMLIEGQKGTPPTRLNLQFATPGGKQLPEAEKRALLIRILSMSDYVLASHKTWVESGNVNPAPWRRLVPPEFSRLAGDITLDYFLRNRDHEATRRRYPFFHPERR